MRMAPLNMFRPSGDFFTDRSKTVLLLWILFAVCFTHVFINLSYLFLVAWEKTDLLALLCVMFPCVLSLSHMVSGQGVVLDCIDS